MYFSKFSNLRRFRSCLLCVLTAFFVYCCENTQQPPDDNNPDFIYFTDEQNEIDINDDQVLDFIREFEFYTYGGTTITVFYLRPLHNAELLCDTKKVPAFLSVGDSIAIQPPDSLFWYDKKSNLTTCRYYYTNWIGKWAGKTGYIGVRLKADSSFHYGWIKVKMDTTEQYNILFRYAYLNPLPDSVSVVSE